MRYLLDTHALLWWWTDDPPLMVSDPIFPHFPALEARHFAFFRNLGTTRRAKHATLSGETSGASFSGWAYIQ